MRKFTKFYATAKVLAKIIHLIRTAILRKCFSQIYLTVKITKLRYECNPFRLIFNNCLNAFRFELLIELE